MNSAVERQLIRWLHLILSIPIIGYIYGPVAEIQRPECSRRSLPFRYSRSVAFGFDRGIESRVGDLQLHYQPSPREGRLVTHHKVFVRVQEKSGRRASERADFRKGSLAQPVSLLSGVSSIEKRKVNVRKTPARSSYLKGMTTATKQDDKGNSISKQTTNQERTLPMPHYVDGFLLPLPKDKIDHYRQIAEEAGKVWREHGALEYRECVGDDLDVQDQVPFPRVIDTKPDETVVFAWIVFESREHRDQVNAKVMADPRMASTGEKDEMPFDFKRMAYGGFKTIVEA